MMYMDLKINWILLEELESTQFGFVEDEEFKMKQNRKRQFQTKMVYRKFEILDRNEGI